jgi:hypothetical protein
MINIDLRFILKKFKAVPEVELEKLSELYQSSYDEITRELEKFKEIAESETDKPDELEIIENIQDEANRLLYADKGELPSSLIDALLELKVLQVRRYGDKRKWEDANEHTQIAKERYDHFKPELPVIDEDLLYIPLIELKINTSVLTSRIFTLTDNLEDAEKLEDDLKEHHKNLENTCKKITDNADIENSLLITKANLQEFSIIFFKYQKNKNLPESKLAETKMKLKQRVQSHLDFLADAPDETEERRYNAYYNALMAYQDLELFPEAKEYLLKAEKQLKETGKTWLSREQYYDELMELNTAKAEIDIETGNVLNAINSLKSSIQKNECGSFPQCYAEITLGKGHLKASEQKDGNDTCNQLKQAQTAFLSAQKTYKNGSLAVKPMENDIDRHIRITEDKLQTLKCD